jgi:DNA-binding NarL/FixJ family response regulator
MAGGTLVISRAVNNHSYYKKRFRELGFGDVTLTALAKDALHFLIRDLKPSLVVVGARFLHGSTPYMMGELKKMFPKIKMAAVSLDEYPVELGMSFIINGVSSYVCGFEGVDQFYKGLDEIANGREYISPEVVKRIDMRQEYPDPAPTITQHQKEIILMICNGFKNIEIADTLNITKRTVTTHKTEIYTALNVRNDNELIRNALDLEFVTREGLYFYPNDFVVNPLPDYLVFKRRKQ